MANFPFPRKSSNQGPPGSDQYPRGDYYDGEAPGGLYPDAEIPIENPGGNSTNLTGRPDMTPTEPQVPGRGFPGKGE